MAYRGCTPHVKMHVLKVFTNICTTFRSAIKRGLPLQNLKAVSCIMISLVGHGHHDLKGQLQDPMGS